METVTKEVAQGSRRTDFNSESITERYISKKVEIALEQYNTWSTDPAATALRTKIDLSSGQGFLGHSQGRLTDLFLIVLTVRALSGLSLHLYHLVIRFALSVALRLLFLFTPVWKSGKQGRIFPSPCDLS